MADQLKEVRATKNATVYYDGDRYVGSVMRRTVGKRKVWEVTPRPQHFGVPIGYTARTRELAIAMLRQPRS
jgi:hypothetical protein